jgi:hypothetical protein
MDINHKNQLIRKKNHRELEKDKLMNPVVINSLVESFTGMQQMQSYLDRADDRSRSVSQQHARANSYDIQKTLL